MDKANHLDTIWEVPDELWAEIKQVLDELDPPGRRGRPRVDARRALNGIIYRLRSSCHRLRQFLQLNQPPAEGVRGRLLGAPPIPEMASAGSRRVCS